MVSYRLTDDELTYLDQVAKEYIKTPSAWNTWCPARTIPLVREVEWKVMTNMRGPKGSLDGTMTTRAATTYTTSTAKILHLAYDLHWSDLEVETARRTGSSIQTDEMALANMYMDQAIERFIISGSMSWETPDVSGLLASATDVGGYTALDAVFWDTPAGGPSAHAKAMYGAMNALGLRPPYTWVLGENLRKGIADLNASTSDRSSRELIKDLYEVDRIIFVPIAAAAATELDTTIKPFPVAAGDDSRWFAFPSTNTSTYFELQQINGGKRFIFNPEIDMKTKTYYGRLEWAGTMRITHPTAVVDEDQVDLVA